MLQTSARLLRLLSLFQMQRYWSGADLSGRLDITGRTLRRDVDRLRSLGYPVHSTSGTAGGYQLGAGANLPPLLLDDEEAVAVALGLRTSASGSVTGIEEASVRALLKLEQVLPPRLRQRVAALHGFIMPFESRGPTVDAERLSVDRGGLPRSGRNSIRLSQPDRCRAQPRAWNRTAWSTPAIAGTSWPGTWPQGLANLPDRPHRRQAEEVLYAIQTAQAAGGRLRRLCLEVVGLCAISLIALG